MGMAQIATYYEMPPMVSEQAKSLLAKQPQLMELHCQLEVGIGCLQVLLLFTPQRSISVMMFTWQYLRIRYMTNSDVKKAFHSYSAKLDSVFEHQYCPGVIGTIWGKIKGFFRHMGDVEAAQNQRCTIM